MHKNASFKGLYPKSENASAKARGASKKKDTKPEVLLRHYLWKIGLRYRKNVRTMPGIPDIVFTKEKCVVFVDGDFWHGKDWHLRRKKLIKGYNSKYWIAKIENNIDRDIKNTKSLIHSGWNVIRIWESDIYKDIDKAISLIVKILAKHLEPEFLQKRDKMAKSYR